MCSGLRLSDGGEGVGRRGGGEGGKSFASFVRDWAQSD